MQRAVDQRGGEKAIHVLHDEGGGLKFADVAYILWEERRHPRVINPSPPSMRSERLAGRSTRQKTKLTPAQTKFQAKLPRIDVLQPAVEYLRAVWLEMMTQRSH